MVGSGRAPEVGARTTGWVCGLAVERIRTPTNAIATDSTAVAHPRLAHLRTGFNSGAHELAIYQDIPARTPPGTRTRNTRIKSPLPFVRPVHPVP
jgi:hypothetical protein